MTPLRSVTTALSSGSLSANLPPEERGRRDGAGARWDVAEFLVRRRGLVAIGWLLAAAALLPAAGQAERKLDVAARIPGSESAAVDEALATGFSSPFARKAVLVLTGVPPVETAEGHEVLKEVVGALKTTRGVKRTFSYLDSSDPLLRGEGGRGTFLIVGLDPGNGPLDTLIPSLRAATQLVDARLKQTHSDATLRWTGQAVLNFDVRQASTREVREAERRALPVTLVLVFLAFRALTASVLPIVAGAVAILLALGSAVLLTAFGPLSLTLQSVVSMLGLGLGIDYALLTVSRFREALAAGHDSEAAAVDAARHAGPTVALSGAAVAIGFLGMLLVPLREIRSVAVGGLLVVAISVLLATTLLPGVLAWLGPRVDFGRLPLGRRRGLEGEAWLRWGRRVAARPVVVLVAAGLPVAMLALGAWRMNTELPRGRWLPDTESSRALGDLEAMGRAGVIQSISVLLDLPEGISAVDKEGWKATRRLADALGADRRVARVRSLPAIAADRADDLMYVAMGLPASVKGAFVSEEGDGALVELVPREGLEAKELARFVRELRLADAEKWTGLPGARLRVGGLPGFNVDYEDAVAGRFTGVVGLVVGGTLLALLVGFRSVLIPLKAVALNLLSVAAAFGALVLVFQEGHGASWFGLAEGTGSVFRSVPIYVFCIVFGLSMDYEVFLVARVAEARRSGMGDSEALAHALARTGAVITSAAAIMIAVFAAFTLGDFLLTKMLGFALAVAVFLDGTLIRVAVGPALLRLAGRWNWWPGEGTR